MAIQQSWDDDEEEGQQGEQVISNQSNAMQSQGGGGGSQQAQGQTKQTSSGSWTNLMDYVDANSGEDARMGEKVESNIAGRADQATQSGKVYQDSASQAIDQGTVRDQGIVAAVGSNPVDVKQNQEEQFRKQWDATYGGPKAAQDVAGYQDTAAQYRGVEDRAKNAQTHAGRQALLTDEYNRPNYTSGEKSLDSFILGAGDAGKQTLANINQNYSNYASGWDDLVNTVQGDIQQGMDTTAQTRDATRGAVNDARSNLTSNFGDAQNQADYANDELQRLRRALSGTSTGGIAGGPSPMDQALAELGVNKDVATFLMNNGMNLGSLLRNDQAALGDFVRPEDKENYTALLDLIGEQSDYDFSKSDFTMNPYDIKNNLVNDGAYLSKFRDRYDPNQRDTFQNQLTESYNRLRNSGFDRTGQYWNELLAFMDEQETSPMDVPFYHQPASKEKGPMFTPIVAN